MLNNNQIQILYNVVLKHCKVTDEEFKGIRRNHNIVTARAMYCYILRKKKFTLKFIADLLKQTHPNVIAHCNNIESYLKFSNDYRILYNSIIKDFNKLIENELNAK